MPTIDFVELFTRLGRSGSVAYGLNGEQVDTADRFDTLSALYEDTADEDLVAGLLASKRQLVTSVASPMGNLTPLAQSTVNRMVGVSTPASGRSVPSALVELIRQMRINTVSVAACAVTAVAAALSGNVG